MTDWNARLTHALKTGTETALVAGEYLLKEISTLREGEIDEKGLNDFVTRVDRKSEQLIRGAISKEFPKDVIIGEESGGGNYDAEYLWIVDPLDGTHNYIHRLPHFAVSIAMAVNGRPEVAAVYDPVRREMFSCKRNEGVWLNNEPIAVSGCSDPGKALVGTGLPARYRAEAGPYLAQLGRVIPAVASIRRSGSAALDLAYVAAGRLDGFWEPRLSPWDMAGGMLLIEAAGGMVTDEKGEQWKLQSTGIIATNSSLHNHLTNLIVG